MEEALEIVGIVALVISGFLIAAWVGFLLIGVGCIGLSGVRSFRRRRAAEELRLKRMGLAQ